MTALRRDACRWWGSIVGPALALILLMGIPRPAAQVPDAADEIRALWVLRGSLASPETIATMTQAARAAGFNTLLVQVRGRADAYYSSALEPPASDLAARPASFDPLAEVLTAAHQRGLRVHAWINVDLVASATDLPDTRDHLIYRHPEWLMVPRRLAQEMANVEVESPAYVGRLARWARAQPTGVEGFYASPIHPEMAAHTTAVVADLVARYAVDGVHLDYVRYPDDRFDHSRFAVQQFRAEVALSLPHLERHRLDRLAGVDVLAYPDALPEEWRNFRRARLSSLVMRVRTAVKSRRPAALLTAAVTPDADEAFNRKLQDWPTWLENGLVDAVCPMAYSPEVGMFTRQIAAARDVAGARGVWAGIGAYRLSPAETIQHIESARRIGVSGIVLFSYDSMTGTAQRHANYLTEVGQAAFGDRRAATTGSR